MRSESGYSLFSTKEGGVREREEKGRRRRGEETIATSCGGARKQKLPLQERGKEGAQDGGEGGDICFSRREGRSWEKLGLVS